MNGAREFWILQPNDTYINVSISLGRFLDFGNPNPGRNHMNRSVHPANII